MDSYSAGLFKPRACKVLETSYINFYYMRQVLLHIELTGRKIPGTDQEEMRFQQKGDPKTWAEMVRTVMQHNQEIAASFMAAVIDYCHEEGIDCGDLSSMVIFGKNGPLNRGRPH